MTIESKKTIKSNTSNLKDIRSFIRDIAKEGGFSDKDIDGIVLAVDEACSNIMRHAYKGDLEKDIMISCINYDTELEIVIQDFGIKPDLDKMKHVPSEKLRQGGYGVICIKKVMDEVYYDTSPKEGTILTLIKFKK